MCANKKNIDTSIELVSNEGPLPIHVMMQEGVKALTTILSNQLQDGEASEKAQHSMQFVIKDNGQQLINETTKDNSNVIDSDNTSITTNTTNTTVIDINDKNLKRDKNNGNKNVSQSKKNVTINKSQVQEFINEDLLDPDLHLDGEEAEIIFDYETHDASPDAIGRRISEMIESVLPNRFSADTQGKLHAVINGSELSITELDSNTVASLKNNKHKFLDDHEQRRIEEIVNDTQQFKMNSSIDINNIGSEEYEEEEDNDINEDVHNAENTEQDINTTSFDNEVCCPHHSIKSNPRVPQRFRNYNYHDFNYNSRGINNNNKRPDFSVLIDKDKPMCMFCEYYMVFGEPPKNMIKWYNSMFGYNRLPPSSNRDRNQHRHQQQGHRKRNC